MKGNARTQRIWSLLRSAAIVTLLVWGAPVVAHAQCGEDALEDNDSCATARAISSPFTGFGLVAYKTDPDYFSLTVPAGDELNIDIFFTHSVADLELFLYDANGSCGGIFTYLSRSITSSNDERIRWTNTSSAPVDVVVKVEVFPGSIPTCNTYDMALSVVQPIDPCDVAVLDDGLEDNDDCASAAPLPLGSTPGLWVSRSDEDFYTVTLQAGEILNVQTLFTDTDGDLDLYLYDAAGPCGGGIGSGELASAITQTDNEMLTWSNTSGGPRTVILQVEVYITDDCNSYELISSISGGGIGTNYCSANFNSSGMRGLIAASGTDSFAANNITLRAFQLPTASFGFFLNSKTQGFVMNPAGSEGNLCLGGEVGRHDDNITNTGSGGEIFLTIDLSVMPQPTGAVSAASGETWHFQAWHRDAVGGMTTSNLTNALRVVLTP